MVPHLYTYFLPCFRHLENGKRLGALPSAVTGTSIFLLLYFSVPNRLRAFYYTYYA
jgi:hypothetical protein